MTNADLLALADRVEKLAGPDRKTDCEIHAAIIGGKFKTVGLPFYDPERYFANPSPEIDWIGYDLLNVAPHYTASLDAAMTLMPRPMCWNGGEVNEDDYPWACITDGEGNDYAATGATPALALTAASLCARASTDKGEA